MELCDGSVRQLAGLLRAREVSAEEIAESVFERIEAREPSLNAFVTTCREQALEQARRADDRLRRDRDAPLLTGIPVAVKDILCTKGVPTTCGSRILRGFVPTYDATAVERLREDGAVLVGKTNMDEFAMGSSTEHGFSGPTRNPVDPAFVAGGSSGGSAAAVRAGECVLALGSDTGGSIRQPAAFCGVVGLKPTYGRVSRYGLVSYASSLDQAGPMARGVEDCAIALNSIAGHDPRDSTSARVSAPDFTRSLDEGVAGVRIGLPAEYFAEGIDPVVKERVMAAVERLQKSGAEVVDVTLPHTPYAVSSYYLIATAEASSNLARYDGVRYGWRAPEEGADITAMIEATRSEGFGDEVKRRIVLGTYVLSAGYYDAYYLKAQKARSLIKRDFDAALEKVDCLVTPTSPCLPFRLGEKLADPLQMYLVDVCTVSLNLSGLPGISVSCGTGNGLPVGMQIVGRAFDEETVLRVARAHETLSGES